MPSVLENGNVFVFALAVANRRQHVTNVSMISYEFKTHFENYECVMPQQPRRSKTTALRAFCFRKNVDVSTPNNIVFQNHWTVFVFLEGSDY